jgi:hypothetical protein
VGDLRRRAVAAALIAAVVVAGCAGPTATTAPSTPTTSAAASPTDTPTGPPRCTTAELSGSLTDAQGTTGTVYRTLLLTNVGRQTCELRGFPGVSYVAGEDGHQVGPSAEMVGERGAQVRLDPGHAAVTAIGMVQVANFDPAVCRPTPVRGLRVYPPGDTASLFVAVETTGCAGTPPGPQLTVGTLVTRS